MKKYFDYKVYFIFLFISIIQVINRLFVKEDYSGRPILECLVTVIVTPILLTLVFSIFSVALSSLFKKQPKEIGKDGYTLLMDLCHKGNLDDVKNSMSLIQQTLNFQDDKGFSALFYAVSGGNVDIVKYLLEQGADREIKSKQGNNALYFAEKNNQHDIAKLLK
jgi:ankyrin repeat protein